MKMCILCDNYFEKLTDEHIVEDSLGGILHIDCLCKECNSGLGSRVDSLITNSNLLLPVRYKYNLRGKNKSLPKLRDANITIHDGIDTGLKGRLLAEKHKIEVVPKIIKNDKESFFIIANTKKEMEQMAEKVIERMNDGSKLEKESLNNLPETSIVINEINLKVNINKELELLILPLMKIAFEMSYLIFGDKYLADDVAKEYKKILYSVARENTNSISINKNWFQIALIKNVTDGKTECYFYNEDIKLFFEIKLFNIYAKFLVSHNSEGLEVTNESKHYLSSVESLDYFFDGGQGEE